MVYSIISLIIYRGFNLTGHVSFYLNIRGGIILDAIFFFAFILRYFDKVYVAGAHFLNIYFT